MSASREGQASAFEWWAATGAVGSGVFVLLANRTFDVGQVATVLPFVGRGVALVLLGIVCGVLFQRRLLLKSLGVSLLCLGFGDHVGDLKSNVALHLVLTPLVAVIIHRVLSRNSTAGFERAASGVLHRSGEQPACPSTRTRIHSSDSAS